MTLPLIAVCGLGRCGSTLVMEMLDEGGIHPYPGGSPRGYEHTQMLGSSGRQWLRHVTYTGAGHSIKLLGGAVDFTQLRRAPGGWVFIWLSRNHEQQARSQAKLLDAFLRPSTPTPWEPFADSFTTEEATAHTALRSVPGSRFYSTSFEHILAHPWASAAELAGWVEPLTLDVAAAAGAVIPRTPECQPTLDFEATGVMS